MNRHNVSDDLVWIGELEMTVEFRGAWTHELLLAPAFPILFAECHDAPLLLEAYPMDPDHFASAEAVARDLVYNRLQRISLDEIGGTAEQVDLSAIGMEDGRRIQLIGRTIFDNDTYYAIAFSSDPNTIARERWRIEAMLGMMTFGRNRGYGRGVRGLLNMVGSQLTESDVPVGQSRSQVASWIAARRKRTQAYAQAVPAGPPGYSPPATPPPIPPGAHATPPSDGRVPWAEGEFAELERSQRAPAPPPRSDDPLDFDDASLAAFEASLNLPPPEPEPEPQPPWPKPWEPLRNAAPERAWNPAGRLPVRFSVPNRDRREMRLLALADAIPAELSYYAEKVFGVGERAAYRETMPCALAGLEAIPMALEAALQLQRGDVALDEALPIGPPRRAPSAMGRSIPEGHGVAFEMALDAMLSDDDRTAFDLVGWRLGWREVQSHLPSFGLERHTVITPARARALAMTQLDGPLQGLGLSERIERWRGLDEDGRRQVIGQTHNANLHTPLEDLERAYNDMAHDGSIPWSLKARWALALGPRGTAVEYGHLIASLARGEVLSPAHSGQTLARLRACSGDLFSGRLLGVSTTSGKLGQTFGAMASAGILSRVRGDEVALCMMVRDIQTNDHTGLIEQLRELAALVYLFVLED